MVRAPTLRRPQAASTEQGFSLVELVVVIVITGIIASVVGLFITGPIQAFLDQSRRAALVDTAQIALIRMGRDLRGALPNSIRTDGSSVLELLATLDGDRYRVELPGTAADRLEFAREDDSFNTLAPLFPQTPLPGIGTFYPVTGSIAIYPLQQGSGADPYSDDVMTASGNIRITPVDNNGQTEYQVSLISAGAGAPGAHRFKFESPTRRVFLVQGPVMWQCDLVNQQLLRYDNYSVNSVLSVPLAVTPTIIVGNVQSCAFQYNPGTALRNAVVSVALSLANPASPNERIRLIRQIHVGNAP
jgi:MSHA biogenesis protein MshO